MPAWIERSGLLMPLAAGAELKESDVLRTGRNARLLVKLGEGSLVRLGENAQLKLFTLNARDDGRSAFRAKFELTRGPFRFATDRRAPSRPREIEVKIASITAALKGSDVWVEASADRTLVCLIDGALTLRREGSADIVMQDPMSVYALPQGASPEAAQTVSLGQLAQWALQTDLGPGHGAAMRGGKWKLILAESPEQAAALDVYVKLRKAGFAASMDTAGNARHRNYLVTLGEIPDRAGAELLAARLKSEFGFDTPRIAR